MNTGVQMSLWNASQVSKWFAISGSQVFPAPSLSLGRTISSESKTGVSSLSKNCLQCMNEREFLLPVYWKKSPRGKSQHLTVTLPPQPMHRIGGRAAASSLHLLCPTSSSLQTEKGKVRPHGYRRNAQVELSLVFFIPVVNVSKSLWRSGTRNVSPKGYGPVVVQHLMSFLTFLTHACLSPLI